MSDFDKFYEAVRAGVEALAKDIFPKFFEDAVQDGNEFLDSTRQKLIKWTKELANGELTEGEFKALMRSQKSLAQMTLIKQRGLAKVAIDKFRRKMIDLVIDTAFDVFLPI